MKKSILVAITLFTITGAIWLLSGCGNPTGGGGGGGSTTTIYNLLITVTPEGTGTVEADPAGWGYAPGITVEIVASGEAGYIFSSWEGDAHGFTFVTSVTMEGSKNIKAIFRASTAALHPLAVSVSPEIAAGTVIQSGASPYTDGSYVMLTAEAGPDFVFDHWAGELNTVINPIVVMMNQPKEIQAVFRLVNSTHTLNVSVLPAGAGIIRPSGGVYDRNTVVQLSVEANEGQEFISWEGDATGTSNSVTVTMESDKNVVARFKSWKLVGDEGFNVGAHSYLTLKISNGTPYVGFYDSGQALTVMKYNGSNWETVGLPGFTGAYAEDMSFDVYNDTPYVSFSDGGRPAPIRVMKFNGITWETVGIPHFSNWGVNYTSIYVYNGTPYVAYQDNDYWTSSQKATVMKFNGTTWEAVGSERFSSGKVYDVSLYVYNGTPYIAYHDSFYGGKVTVMKYDSGWLTVGSANFSAGDAFDTVIQVYNGTPYVAYKDAANGNRGTVMKFNGSDWETVGSAGFTSQPIAFSSFHIYNGIPYFAYGEDNSVEFTTVMKFNGTSWVQVGNKGFSAHDGWTFCQSLYVYDGVPYVAFTGRGYFYWLTVMKYQ